MNRKLVTCAALGFFLIGASLAPAHPHFSKSVTAKLPSGAEATVTYNTTPSNEMHANNAAVGAFVTPRGPRLKLSADITADGATIAAGEYTIGVIKNSDSDWSMALYPGAIARGTSPDMSKVIKLTSQFSKAHGTAAHMLIDITPGNGKFEGKAVLTLHFGSLHLEGALS